MPVARACGRTVRIFPTKVFTFVCLVFVIFYAISLPPSFYSSVVDLKSLETERGEIIKSWDSYIQHLAEANGLSSPSTISKSYFPSLPQSMQGFAVFLDSLKNRIIFLESKVDALETKVETNSKDVIVPHKIENPGAIIQSKSEECPFPDLDAHGSCKVKIAWMREMWKSDQCYAEWGVDGSDCTIYHYLSEVEHWCPLVDKTNTTSAEQIKTSKPTQPLVFNQNFTDLYAILGRDAQYKWIKMRMRRMERSWLEAVSSLNEKFNAGNWKQKKVLLVLGLLAKETGFKIADNAFKGGPLGELVQWSDLITALYVLGHDIKVTNSMEQLRELFTPYLTSASSNCPLQSKPYDILYTDISGLRLLKQVAGNKFHLLKCEIRVVDSFGTEPEFNHASYAERKMRSTQWGKWNFHPKQFNTMFPHTPDNTFLGFVIEQHNNVSIDSNNNKENISLVYGKKDSFWEGSEAYIEAIHKLYSVHGTVDASNELQHVPAFVENHGVLPGIQLHSLLRKTKVFVGMGFPYEGPAPLEAIANGAVFLNVNFKQGSPSYVKATNFFKGKPTSRQLTSQHPYTSSFIGRPHVYDVDKDNLEEVKEILTEIFARPNVEPYMPYEFTCLGMLERLGLLVEKQDFCTIDATPTWPPITSLKTVETTGRQTCVEACAAQEMICEPAYFPYINLRTHFEQQGIKCDQFKAPEGAETEIDYPAHAEGTCYIQSDKLLFSCAGRYTNLHHICPCRNFIKGQVALCKACLPWT
ncbi:alpha-1,6-mannosylglycoprotein 6-beta-N-acetylglucosaminyltransferase A-like [Ciona intestinalis]